MMGGDHAQCSACSEEGNHATWWEMLSHSESQRLHRWRTVSALKLRPDSVTYAPRFQRGQVTRKACVVDQAILEDRRRQGIAGD